MEDLVRESSTWVEVDLRATQHNLTKVRRLVGEDTRILAVVKANAYGHGLETMANALCQFGVHYLGVTTVEEGARLREADVTKPILIFAPCLPRQAPWVIRHGLTQTVQDFALAQALSSEACARGKTARLHVKVDTGMGRIGVVPQATPVLLEQLRNLAGVEVEGIYTHFADAFSRDKRYARSQLHQFLTLCDQLRDKHLLPSVRHCANSAAVLALPESHLDMVRVGTLLYGEYPSRHVPQTLDLRPTWRWKARVVGLREVRKGASIGYGRHYVARRDMRVAALPVGYADGLTLEPNAREPTPGAAVRRFLGGIVGMGRPTRGDRCVMIHGRSCAIVGRVSMQLCCVDVTELADVTVGDEVLLKGRRTAVPERIRRIYV